MGDAVDLGESDAFQSESTATIAKAVDDVDTQYGSGDEVEWVYVILEAKGKRDPDVDEILEEGIDL